MRQFRSCLLFLLTICLSLARVRGQAQSDDYPFGPDSQPQPNVPAGKTFSFDLSDSKIFPGARHTITVYIPAAYTPEKPACAYVGLDSLGFNAPVVFDNLIAQHAMPVTIGIGLSSGTVDSIPPDNPRFDRSFEFDSFNDRLPRFLLEEVLPAVESHTTPDGKPIILSKSANDRAIGGGSTGGIGAFTVAWQRPDAFRRVFTAIGTFVGMRGGEQYYVLVRKTEPKPIRIFMQDGAYDEWGGGPEMGDWWMSNQTMERALGFAGYDVRHVWGTGTHNDRHASTLFPDAMRFLWHGWPDAVEARSPGNPVLQAILQSGSPWEVVAQDCAPSAMLAADSDGNLHLGEGAVDDDACPHTAASRAIAFGPDGHAITAAAAQRLLGPRLRVNGLTVRRNGDVYATVETSDAHGEVWRISGGRTTTKLDAGLAPVSGIAFSPDGLWLVVAPTGSRWAYSYRVKPDGTLDARAPIYNVATLPGATEDSKTGNIWMDVDGRTYMATDMGVQVFDRNGRVAAILPLPNHAAVTSISFAGKDWTTLYAAGGGMIFRRKLKVAGAPPWAPAIKLPKWGAG